MPSWAEFFCIRVDPNPSVVQSRLLTWMVGFSRRRDLTAVGDVAWSEPSYPACGLSNGRVDASPCRFDGRRARGRGAGRNAEKSDIEGKDSRAGPGAEGRARRTLNESKAFFGSGRGNGGEAQRRDDAKVDPEGAKFRCASPGSRTGNPVRTVRPPLTLWGWERCGTVSKTGRFIRLGSVRESLSFHD